MARGEEKSLGEPFCPTLPRHAPTLANRFRGRCDRFYDDVDEMQAFRSMFMELVDMLGSDMPPMSNGCVPGCQGGHSHISPGKPIVGETGTVGDPYLDSLCCSGWPEQVMDEWGYGD